jgi:glutaredoxin
MHTQVLVYTRPLCLFCHQVLELLHRSGVVFEQRDVVDRGQQEVLIACYRSPAFPIVLVDGSYVGGYAHVLHLHSQGRLEKLNAREGPPAAPAPPPTDKPSQRSLPSLMQTMSRLQRSLNEEDGKKA